ncbi:hypothetical protein KUW17_21475 [Leisingera aquaemixtae]|uniref:hypothetical protein n=1 Tax=Leisingera aquaemixtae TaxID=1396826 RepID=UPI001C98E1E0|nr:hypothetical protein [Leisingera aquaemixtae]MBY6069329.1 hypothetical protein [Leisingera aquaemixtae]
MCGNDQNFDAYAFSKQPGFDEAAVRKEFAKAVPLKTVVVYCYDPRIAQVPRLVAEEFGQTHPGDIVTDDSGNKIASTTNVFEVCVAGGRAYDALRSVTVAQHLFGVENIVIVHHTHCGATSFTKQGIIDAYRQEHDADIAPLYPAESICISDYTDSLEHDVQLMRGSAGTPKHANIYGYMYDIDKEKLVKVTQSLAA